MRTVTQLIFFSIVRAGDAIYVRVGDHDLTQKFGSPGAQTLRVATTYIHHNHNSQTLDNDIALLKLHGDAELKEGVCLVSLCGLKARVCVMPLYRSAYQPGGRARLRGKSAQSQDTATWEKVSYHWALFIEVGILFGDITGHLSPSVGRAYFHWLWDTGHRSRPVDHTGESSNDLIGTSGLAEADSPCALIHVSGESV